MATRFIGVWFPTTTLALVLLPLGGARSPLVLNTLLVTVSAVFLIAFVRSATNNGVSNAASTLIENSNSWALLALPGFVTIQAGVHVTIGLGVAPRLVVLESALYLSVLVAFFVCARAATRDSRGFNTMLLALVVIGAIEAYYGLFNLLAGNEYVIGYKRTIHLASATGTFYSRNPFAYLMEMTLPAGVALAAVVGGRRRDGEPAAEGETRARQVLAGTAVVGIALALLFSQSRMGIAALAAACAIVASVNKLVSPDGFGHARTRTGVALCIVAVVFTVGFAAVIGLEPALERFFSIPQDMEQGRWPLWQATLQMISEKPILGHGWGSYESLIAAYRDRPSGISYAHAHNEYLEVLAEAGILGLIVVLALIGLFARRLVTALSGPLSRPQRTVIVGLGIAITSVLLHSAADFGLRVPAIALAFMITLALFTRITENPMLVDPDFDPETALRDTPGRTMTLRRRLSR